VKRVRKFRELPHAERLLLIRAAALLCMVRLGLWLLPFRRLSTLVQRGKLRLRPDGPPSAERIGWAIRVASRYVPRATCLAQALAALAMLERAGLPAQLYIGVARNDEQLFQAHAWVESRGNAIVGGSDLEGYAPLLVVKSRIWELEPKTEC
jgi:transglutaminase superfamily protein